MARGSPALTFSVLLAALFGVLAAAEGAARLRWSEEDVLPVPEMAFLEDDPLLLWRVRPRVNLEPWPGVALLTNEQGLRDGPVGEKGDRPRVLMVGESTTWGYGVAADQAYPARVEAALAASGAPVDVVNAGQPAWSVWQTARFLETEGAAYRPDLVVTYHLLNDRMTRGASNPRDPFRVALTDRQLSEARAPFAPVSRVLDHSRLRAVVWKELLAPRLTPPAGGAGKDAVRVPDVDRRAAYDLIRTWCGAHQVRLLLLQPVYARRTPSRDTLVPEYAAAHGLPVVDLAAARDAQGEPDWFMPDDTHPTPAGHAWIASQLVAPIRSALAAAP